MLSSLLALRIWDAVIRLSRSSRRPTNQVLVMPVTMPVMLQSLSDRWRRRYWRADTAALSAFAGLAPVTIITGASEGIGRAFTERLAAEGQALLLIARDGAKLEALADKLRTQHRAQIIALPLDLTAGDATRAIDRSLASMHGYADSLINNAGIGLAGTFSNTPIAAIDAVMALNVAATTRLARHLLPGMLVRGRGGILFVASLVAYTPGPNQAVYCASKAYLLSLAEAIAAETAGLGVRVCCTAPGPVETAFHAKMGADRALYRWAIPNQSPDRVAAVALLGYRLGVRVLVPGLLTAVLALALRLLPHRLTLPIVHVLLRPLSTK
jgi:uncharacterized protein